MLFVFPFLSFFPPLLLGVDLLEDLLLEDLTLTEEAEDFPDVFPEEVDLPREDLLLLLLEEEDDEIGLPSNLSTTRLTTTLNEEEEE